MAKTKTRSEAVAKRKAQGSVRANVLYSKFKKQNGVFGVPEESNIVDPWQGFRGPLSIIHAPFPLERLLGVADTSNILPQCIGVMEVNVDGQGYTFDRIVDPTKDSPLENEEAIQQEKEMLNDTFNYINFEHSFTRLRRIMRIDLETYGNAYWEVIRSMSGKVVELNHIPSVSMRLTAREEKALLVDQKVIQGGKVVTRKRWRKWHRFVQFTENQAYIYFKEFGDTRFISAKTGNVVQTRGPQDRMANEVIHFKLHWAGRSPYGLPRWIGNMLSSLGSRASEELNYLYFVQGRHFPFAILVSGGMLTSESEKKIQELLDEAKGIENAHKVLILEAESATDAGFESSANVKLDIKPLVDVLPDDALFQKYDKNNRDKVRTSFRFPKVLLGESEDYNRDTVDAAIKVANAQVFDVERRDFDAIINRRLLPELGAVHHVFKSKAFSPIGATDMSNILFRLNKMGAVTPRNILPIVRDMLGIDLQFPDSAEWLDRPIEITTELIKQQKITEEGEAGAAATAEEQKALALVKELGIVPKQAAKAVDMVEGLVTLKKMLEKVVEDAA